MGKGQRLTLTRHLNQIMMKITSSAGFHVAYRCICIYASICRHWTPRHTQQKGREAGRSRGSSPPACWPDAGDLFSSQPQRPHFILTSFTRGVLIGGEMEYKEAEEARRVDALRVSGEQIYRLKKRKMDWFELETESFCPLCVGCFKNKRLSHRHWNHADKSQSCRYLREERGNATFPASLALPAPLLSSGRPVSQWCAEVWCYRVVSHLMLV